MICEVCESAPVGSPIGSFAQNPIKGRDRAPGSDPRAVSSSDLLSGYMG
jgi:hypothetical protein